MLIKYGHAYDDPKSAQDEILNKEGKGWRQILSRLAIFSFLFSSHFCPFVVRIKLPCAFKACRYVT